MEMPLNKLLYLGAGVSGLATISGTLIYLNQKNKSENNPTKAKTRKTIKELLKTQNKEILDKETGDISQWNSNWVNFVNAYANLENKKDWQFEILNNENYKQIAEAPKEFKEKCDTNGNELSDNNKIYNDIIAYCLKAN